MRISLHGQSKNKPSSRRLTQQNKDIFRAQLTLLCNLQRPGNNKMGTHADRHESTGAHARQVWLHMAAYQTRDL